MATKLNLVFVNSEGGTTSYTWNYAKPSTTKLEVTTLASAMIANTTVLASTLISLKSAKTVTTTENVYELDNNTREVDGTAEEITNPDRVEEIPMNK